MRCQSCGANADGAFCEYCGSKMPAERVEAQVINAQSVVVNNYYQSVQQAGAPDEAAPAASPKSKAVALVLWLLLGVFGAHRFYIGSYGLAVVYLLTLGLLGIGWIVDLVLLLLGRLEDRDGLVIVNW